MRASSGTERTGGFTLLEIMLTLALVAIGVIPVLLTRERSVRQSYRAHHLNTARTLARELLTELEFHELDQMSGEFDGYPGFSYDIEVEEVDLVTGQEEEDEDNPYSTQGGYQPADSIDPEEGEEMDYPVRRVTLTLKFPNLKLEATDDEELKIITIFPPLPKDDDEFGTNNPFN